MTLILFIKLFVVVAATVGIYFFCVSKFVVTEPTAERTDEVLVFQWCVLRCIIYWRYELKRSFFDSRDLTQLGRERRRRRLLKFELSVFPFLVCVTHSFLFNFA